MPCKSWPPNGYSFAAWLYFESFGEDSQAQTSLSPLAAVARAAAVTALFECAQLSVHFCSLRSDSFRAVSSRCAFLLPGLFVAR